MAASDASEKRIDAGLLVQSVVIMAVAGGLYGVTYTFDEVPPILAQGVQPTVFPRVLLILMILLAGLQAIKALRPSVAEIAKLKPYRPIPRIVFLTALVLIGFFVVMPIIGTFPTLIIFCPALAALWGERRWKLMALSFGGFIAFIYGLFVMVLNVPLP